MSHSENKVTWCLKKAEEELKASRKHRGLVKKQENTEEARKHIMKAEHNLQAINYFHAGGFSDWSMSASFYCIYHCFLAIIEKFGYESKNQECTIALVNYLKEQGKIKIEEKFIESLKSYSDEERHETSIIEKREDYTYGTIISIKDKEEIDKSAELCKECIDKTKDIVFTN